MNHAALPRLFLCVLFLLIATPSLADEPTAAVTSNQPTPSINDPDAITYWQARSVDGKTGQPLPGIKLRVEADLVGETVQKWIEMTSDERGLFQVALRDRHITSVYALTAGWWNRGSVIGDPKIKYVSPDGSDKVVTPPLPDQVTDVPLWRGTTVMGRLLFPDQTPAAGAILQFEARLPDPVSTDPSYRVWDLQHWPNWGRGAVTGDDGTFTTTVPPQDQRRWLRVSTSALGMRSIDPSQVNQQSAQRISKNCAPFEVQIGGTLQTIDKTGQESERYSHTIDFGDLQLQTGVVVRGRVLDSKGNPLSNIRLTTNGRHGPHSGPATVSQKNGEFSFLPITPRSLTIHADARLRVDNGQVNSRDVQAVFVTRSYPISASKKPVEIVAQAVPHTTVEFEWQDNRINNSSLSNYRFFSVTGFYHWDNGQRVWWRGETVLVERDGQQRLVIKIPTSLENPKLILASDSFVTASYKDETGKTHGPGRVELGDITQPIRRTIIANEPTAQ